MKHPLKQIVIATFLISFIIFSCSNDIKKRSINIVDIIDINPDNYWTGHCTLGLIVGIQLNTNDEQIELKFKDIESYIKASLHINGTESQHESASWGSCASENVRFSFNTRIYTLPPNSTMVFYRVFENIHSEVEGTITVSYFERQEEFIFKNLKDSLGIKYQDGFSVTESSVPGCN